MAAMGREADEQAYTTLAYSNVDARQRHSLAPAKDVYMAIYIDGMFPTGGDAANTAPQ